MRADQLLVSQGLAPTRSIAQRLIERGAVALAGRVIRKAGEDLPAQAALVVTDDAEARYVSRGGLKLEGALRASGVAVAGLHVLDVGHGQLHASLQGDVRVTALEGRHVREYAPAQDFALIVGDLSFISMLGELPRLAGWLAPAGQLLLLIKPQFELGPKALDKRGLVKDRAQYAELEVRARADAAALGLALRGWFESPVSGGDGNTEFFLWAQRPQ